MIELEKLTLTETCQAFRQHDFSAEELTESFLARIEEINPALNAYLEIFAGSARGEARAADKTLASGEFAPSLCGIPLAIKDNILINGKKASAASKILDGYVAPYSASVISRLRKSGAIFLGRTNLDEFAMGSSTEHSAWGPAKNPLDKTRVPGGSSGGSAAAVAASLCLGALGSDTGGSIRQPASFCGVVGLKPTYGAVSRYGLIALASSLDQIGPLAKTVEDTKLIFEAIRGRDEMDSTSSDASQSASAKTEKVIGVPYSFLEEGVNKGVLENFEASLKALERAGYKLEEVELPNSKYALPCYYIIMPAEASANLARYDGLRYGNYQPGDDLLDDYLKTRGSGFGNETRRRILLGTFVLSAGYYDAYYGRANEVRAMIRDDFVEAFKKVSAIAMPTTPTTAFRLGEKLSDPVQMYLADLLTAPANLAGLPAISLPSGKDRDGLPFGLQLVAPHFAEERLFQAGEDFEQEL